MPCPRSVSSRKVATLGLEHRPNVQYNQAMPTRKKWSDDELVKIVNDYRAEQGTCSLGDIARATGMMKSAVQYRVDRLIEEGRLTRNASFGSIRGTDEVMMRDVDGRLIEVKAPRRKRSKSSR